MIRGMRAADEAHGEGIVVRGLTKVFHTTVRRPGFAGAVRSLIVPQRAAKTVVRDVSFDVARGELLALLGPNGAGKSTTIKMLTGILTPTRGEVMVAGMNPHLDRKRNARNIGAVFGQRTQLWWDLPAKESFTILRSIYGVPAERHRARLAELDRLLELSEFWDTRVRHLSLGQRVRCDLAAALLHDPAIVFLDEPTIGMDVVVKEQVRGLLRHEVEQRGRAVLLTTHDMTEVERLAERVVLINHGRIVLDGTLEEVRREFGGTWRIRATVADSASSPSSQAVRIRDLPAGLELLSQDRTELVFAPAAATGDTPAITVPEALRAVVDRYPIVGISIEETDLEDAMRAAYLRQGVATAEPEPETEPGHDAGQVVS
jgi:ABC-2 type transport system ATP-binding protein